MTLTRYGRIAATAATSALLLTACGSDSNSDGAGASSSPSGSSSASASASASPSTSGSTAAGGDGCATGSVTAEGSTAQKNAMETWIAAYQTKCSGAKLNYNATGSGAGITQFNAKQVDFAGSDSALDAGKGEVAAAAKACGSPAWNLPMAVGPIAVAFKLSGVDTLVLDGPTTAKVFLGTIKKWNDPAIAALNAGVKLPDTAITVFFRSDESGTTQNFEKYLAASGGGAFTAEPSKTWAGKVGQGKSGSSAVQQAVSATDGAVTYIEYSFAKDAKLGVAKIDNGAGAVELTADSAGKAIAAATPAGTGNDLALKLDYATKAAGAYPIVLVTYEIVCSKGSDPAKAALIKAFLGYTSSADGQGAVSGDLGYGTLPEAIATKVTASIAALS